MKLVVEKSGGKKEDAGKQDLSYIPEEWVSLWEQGVTVQALYAMDRIMAYGAAKYGKDNFRLVSPDRYWVAMGRHWDAHSRGELVDKDTGELHMHHVGCNAGILCILLGSKPEPRCTELSKAIGTAIIRRDPRAAAAIFQAIGLT